jgi:hypothetical protein
MSLAKVTDHWTDTVSDFILEQYKGASNWKAILKSVIDEFTDIEDEIWKLAPILDFKCRVKGERPSGALLDFVASLKNVYRKPGENDGTFYERFLIAVSEDNAGTPNNVIYNAAILSGDNAPQYMDEADCVFFVYDGVIYEHHEPEQEVEDPYDTLIKEPGVKQLTHAQVRKLAPCGVLGLPGAALNMADDTLEDDPILLMVDPEDEWGGKLLIFVADDSTVENELVLSDNYGNVIMASQGAPVSVTIKGGVSVPTIPATVGGTSYDTVRIKDLQDVNAGFMVRDSEEGGTGKAHTMTENELETLWEDTPAEDDNDG